jgi:hypothetical protein
LVWFLGLSFKQGFIERTRIDINAAQQAMSLINQRVQASHSLLADL